MTYDRSTEDAVPALQLNGTPLSWFHLDDGVMGGQSTTRLSPENGALHFSGMIDANASVGWASTRASLPEGLPANTNAIQVNVCGDGKTYKVLLYDNNHESHIHKTPLWEANLATKAASDASSYETIVIPITSFIPSFMGAQLSAAEKIKYGPTLNPANMTKIGFMLSSRLADGTKNPVDTYGQGKTHFDFSLLVKSVNAVAEQEAAKL